MTQKLDSAIYRHSYAVRTPGGPDAAVRAARDIARSIAGTGYRAVARGLYIHTAADPRTLAAIFARNGGWLAEVVHVGSEKEV